MFENDKKEYPEHDDCRSIIEKFLTICLPVTTTPCVKVGRIKTECCGDPIISLKKPDTCKDMHDGCCRFTIVQKMKIEIPVDFEATTKVDDLFVDCEMRKDYHDCDKKD